MISKLKLQKKNLNNMYAIISIKKIKKNWKYSKKILFQFELRKNLQIIFW